MGLCRVGPCSHCFHTFLSYTTWKNLVCPGNIFTFLITEYHALMRFTFVSLVGFAYSFIYVTMEILLKDVDIFSLFCSALKYTNLSAPSSEKEVGKETFYQLEE